MIRNCERERGGEGGQGMGDTNLVFKFEAKCNRMNCITEPNQTKPTKLHQRGSVYLAQLIFAHRLGTLFSESFLLQVF